MRQESYFQLERDSRAVANLIAQCPATEGLYGGMADLFYAFVSREGILPISRPHVTHIEMNYLFACFREWAVMVSLPLTHWSNAWAMVPVSMKKHGISEAVAEEGIVADKYRIT